MAPTPEYVAIVMDGNARWARAHGKDVAAGHRAGAKALKRVVQAAPELGIKELTAFSFSTENWQRPEDEVEGLMGLFTEMIESETPELNEENIKLRFIGDRSGVDSEIVEMMEWAEELTFNNARMALFIAFNYGGRAELESAAKAYAEAALEKGSVDNLGLQQFLFAPEMHDPDMLIRTSGEMRISNFLLWQCAYSELIFCDVLWPDFEGSDLAKAVEEYGQRKRRFGLR